jgi:hypothetical protein
LGKKIFTAVLAFVLSAITMFGGAGKYILSSAAAAPKEEKAEVFSPERALPAFPGKDMMVAGITDKMSFRKIMPYISLFGKAISQDAALADSGGEIAKWLSLIGYADVFLDAADSIAVCVPFGDRFYASLSVDGEKFDKLTAGGGPMRFEKWNGAKVPAGGDAWIVKPSSAETAGAPFYMMRWNAGKRDAVNIASGAEEIGEMAEALKNPGKRLRVTRLTEGRNFVAVRSAKRREMDGLSISQAETSWSVKNNLLKIRSYADMYESIAARLKGRTFSPKAAPTLGDGEVAFFAVVDPAFCLSVLFPAAPDPIKAAIGEWGVPQEFAADVEAVLKNCGVSAVVVAEGEALGTAYLVIDAEARESLDKLYMAAETLLTELEAVSPVSIDGLDSAFALRLDQPLNLIAARHEGMVLLGFGEPASFGKQAAVSAGAVPTGVLTMAASSQILEVKVPGSEETVRNRIERYLARNIPEALRDTAWLDKIGRIDLTQFLDGRGEINITFKE